MMGRSLIVVPLVYMYDTLLALDQLARVSCIVTQRWSRRRTRPLVQREPSLAELLRARDRLRYLCGVLEQPRLQLLEGLVRLPEMLRVDRFGHTAVGAPEGAEHSLGEHFDGS